MFVYKSQNPKTTVTPTLALFKQYLKTYLNFAFISSLYPVSAVLCTVYSSLVVM